VRGLFTGGIAISRSSALAFWQSGAARLARSRHMRFLPVAAFPGAPDSRLADAGIAHRAKYLTAVVTDLADIAAVPF
jgi:hypothetical protein